MGAANLAAGISQGFPIGASGSRTSVNDQMGARTQLSGLLSAGVTALVLLFLTGPVEYLPVATLGAVVAASVGMLDLVSWRGLARLSRIEVGIAAITTLGVVSVGVLRALLLAIALSVVDAVAAARLHTTRYSVGSSDWTDTPTYDSIRPPESFPEYWSTGSMIGCSSPTPTTSRGGFAKLSQARRRLYHGWCSTPRRSTMSMPLGCVR